MRSFATNCYTALSAGSTSARGTLAQILHHGLARTTAQQGRNRSSVPVLPFEAILLCLDRKFLPSLHGLQSKDLACDPCFQS
jgi:hypothetical protein